MQSGITAYDLLLSYPSDVSFVTPLIEAAVTEFNNHYGRDHNIVVRPINWKSDTYPTLGEHPEAAIVRQIVDGADFALACFWTRFGTATESFGSGTEEEIERMVGSQRQVFLYFLKKKVDPFDLDQSQFARIQDFRKRHGAKGLYFDVVDEQALVSDFRQKLELFFNAELNKTAIIESSSGKRILWVDDRPENNVYERKLLEGFGIQFSLALSTQQALAILKHETFTLIISDMGRKEGPREGYVLLDALRQQGNTTSLVFFAASSLPEHKDETLAHGGQGCTDNSNTLVNMVFKLLLGGSLS